MFSRILDTFLSFACLPFLPHSPPTHVPYSDQLDQGNQDPTIHFNANIHVKIASPIIFEISPIVYHMLIVPSPILHGIVSGHFPQYPGMYRPSEVSLVAHHFVPAF